MNKPIAGNANEALSLATGDYIAFIDHDDTLAPFALFKIVKAINETPEADFIYSDEDLISENGRIRFEPQFKPGWSPDNLRSYRHISHLTVIKKEVLLKSGLFGEGFECGQEYHLILRAKESACSTGRCRRGRRKLYYPNHTIQHAGVVLRIDGQVLQSFRYFPYDAFGYGSRLKIMQNVGQVTGAYMMRKLVFEEVGGFQ